MDLVQTEFDFVLPIGYVDASGNLHQKGKMRLATAADEIYPARDSKVQSNSSYLPVVLLSRVITSLGSITKITPEIIERLFLKDYTFLQDMYNRINQNHSNCIQAQCPKCELKFEVEAQSLGG
ncbi:MAG: hypothetical protein HUU50_12840 [Candidatus Brocadiae bacterium]|nr:hypothetical protein [Candidatus Brocadiia bacterium]